MRIAFVGLSTPMFYDYKSPASKAPSDIVDSPNPVLDTPFGLFLLYDEIWFLCRSLCPENMRELRYVRFLDESGMLPQIDDIHVPPLHKTIESDPALAERYNRFFDSRPDYMETVKRIGIDWDAAPDNHTHGLQVGNIRAGGNSSIENVLFDIEVITRLGRTDIELITNSFTQGWFDAPNNPIIRASLAEILVIDNIPNYLSSKGPYHPCIDEARENSFLKNYRAWVIDRSAHADVKELSDVKKEVEATIQRAQDEIFLKYLDPKTQYFSAGKTIAGAAADLAIPYLSTVTSIAEGIHNYFETKDRRWQGFIVSTRQLKDKYK
ncbi:MAG TPA: hypothetical protein VE732_09740 [Nitrososphaera sp.]|nr:hypothetical protein [Nitrososphaera sp.]